MYQFLVITMLNALSMNGTYVHIIGKPYSFETSYIDFAVINIDIATKQCTFYSIAGDLITTSGISNAKKEEVTIVDGALSFLKDIDDFYVLRVNDGTNFQDFFYYKLEPQVLEVSIDKCKYKEQLIEIEGAFFYSFRGKRMGEPHLFPVTTVKEDDVEYVSLYTLKKEWLSNKN